MLPHFGGKYWQKVRDSLKRVLRHIERVLPSLPFVGNLFGAESQQKLLFVPDADNKPEVDHKISEAALFRFLLNEGTLEVLEHAEVEMPKMLDVLKDIDKNWEIAEFEAHQSSMHSVTDVKGAFHVFLTFRTTSETYGDYWWSLEKNSKYIVLQRCRNKENVKDKLKGEERKNVQPVKQGLKGKGTIKNLFTILWAQQMIVDNYNIKKSNCQSLATFISKRITEEEYEYKGYFKYSPPPENVRDKKMLEFLINLLDSGVTEWHPLFNLILLGDTDLVDKFIKSGKYDINAFYKGLTPLHLAIVLEKTKMVQHLLNDPINADPTRRDGSGRDALHWAAMYAQNTGIIDVLLAHPKVSINDVDEDGHTALHFAADASNVIAVQKLIEKGADPNIVDKDGWSPLHLAATQRDGIPIIDLLLEAQKVKGMGNVNVQNEQNGRTALCYAAMASNEITAEHLIQKGAELNHRDNDGITPLHAAAVSAKDMQIIKVLLNNINEGDMEQYRNDKTLFLFARRNLHGLEVEIGDRFLEKGIKPPSTESADERFEIDGILKEGNFDINGRDQHGRTPLLMAVLANNVTAVKRLLKKGADPTIRDNKGFTPFHLAVINDRDCEILKLLLANENVDINETTSKKGWTALYLAIVNSNVTTTRVLLSKGANPNLADKDGWTPLHWAAMFTKDTDIVKLLLNHPNVEVNLMNNKGRNALDFAKYNEHGLSEEIANLLREKGAAETEKEVSTKENAMKQIQSRIFSNKKPEEMYNFFSDDKTIPIEAKIDRISEELLLSAIKDSNFEIVRNLLKSGADIRTCGENGANLLHLTSFHAKTTKLIDAILEKGKFDINGVDNDGRTPLHHALQGINPTINTAHLLQKGADPGIADENGVTPLHIAARNAESMDLIDLLLNTEAVDMNCVDKQGWTPLSCARDNKYGLGQRIIARLREYDDEKK